MSDNLALQEEKLILTSIVMQLSAFCNPDMSHLSPSVKEFIEGTMRDYAEHEDDELVQRLMFYANEVLEIDKESLH